MQPEYFVVEWRCFACVVGCTCRERWQWERKWNNRKRMREKHGHQEKWLVFLFHLATESTALVSSPLVLEETIFKQSLDGAARNTGQNVLWFLTKSLQAELNFVKAKYQEDQSVLAGCGTEFMSWGGSIGTQRYFYESKFESHRSVSCHVFLLALLAVS